MITGRRIIPAFRLRLPVKTARLYHDDAAFGHRVPAKYELPDYTKEELDNRNKNAPLLRYVESVRRHGHRAAQIDPLDLMDRDPVGALNPSRYGLDKMTNYPLNGILHLPPSASTPSVPPATAAPERSDMGEGTSTSLTLDEIEKHLMGVYVDKIGVEFMHSPVKSERLWWSHHLETEASSFEQPFGKERRKKIWKLLARSEELDRFLGKKFPNLKRYGCEGAESMLPALDALFEVSAKAGVSSIVLALPHRGRLSLLCDPDLIAFPPVALFSKIKGNPEFDPQTAPGATGDVISHLSGTRDIHYDGKKIKVQVLQNPSHLEAANPVAMGVTRAKQMSLLKSSPADCQLGDKVLCVQLHGDAAFAGQGVVAESLGLSGLPHYGCGGTVHIVVNNNIGYTTPASFARSSIYSSDIGKMIGCPILHVNGDHPEAVARAVDVAFRYKQMFRKDVIIDLICYRRWGHNELDEPAYTQPLMYEKIRSRKSVPELYETRLVSEGIITSDEASKLRKSFTATLDADMNKIEEYKPKSEMLEGKWSGLVWPNSKSAKHEPDTGVERNTLIEVAKASVTLPEDFNIHSRLKRHVSARLKGLDSKVDFATAEAMAFGSLMQEGCDIRISGQDVGRGTFSQRASGVALKPHGPRQMPERSDTPFGRLGKHLYSRQTRLINDSIVDLEEADSRHAMFVDQKSEQCLIPLNEQIDAGKGRLELANSSLSEMAVLGFEVGMSWARPSLLPIWEAQFGDFMNGAQSMIDTFIVGAAAKWLKQSGLVMLLPHGFDGAGPEHSSCKIERFLQLSNDNSYENVGNVNLGVANPSTPAQLFHLLRRQMVRNYRRPLIVASPKGLLRSSAAASSLETMMPGTKFEPVLDTDPNPSANRVILCSGKHYYTLREHFTKTNALDQVSLIRIEELSPFPRKQLSEVLKKYSKAEKIIWAQEEPENQGAWPYVQPRIGGVLRDLNLGGGRAIYAGRRSCATVAVAVGAWHKKEVEEIAKLPLEV